MEKGRRSGSGARSRSGTGGGNAGGSSGGNTSVCRICGQGHAAHEPHVYDYVNEVDEDLTCHICLQPFVAPLDIPCGHTFCGACLNNYLKVQQLCPIDRKPLTVQLCTPSSIVLRKLLEKLPVKCPNRNSCDKTLQRGDLEEHLAQRCPENDVAGAAAAVKPPRGAPIPSSTAPRIINRFCPKHGDSTNRNKGITRLPVLEGEISHIEIPRLATNLGITIVGGADTALRCVVVQEVFAEGLVSQDGRLRPGDQLIEINGIDMTNASHHQACQALRKMSPVLRLGVYRERIEAYSTRSSAHYVEEIHTVTLERHSNQQLGVRLSGWWMEQGIFILEIIPGSPAAKSGQLEPYDRILCVNGDDVASCRLDQASRLIQSNEKVTLVVARKRLNRNVQNRDGHSLTICHGRAKSAPEALGSVPPPVANASADVENEVPESVNNANLDPALSQSQTWQAKLQQISPDRNLNNVTKTLCHERSHSQSCDSLQKVEPKPCQQLPSPPCMRNVPLPIIRRSSKEVAVEDLAVNIKRNLQIEGIQLQQKCVTINKEPNESLGMRIGGGIGSNEGDIPIYIANIHPQGCVGKTQQIWKGDILLNVNGTSLMGLTHTQAVATLKATVENTQVSLGVLEGPETSLGSLNFIPSWLYWQKLPRCLQFPKTVILHRSPGASLGFSIVGGEDPVRGPEAIHILFVVQDSPAAKHGKLRCGDRLLAVDGHSLENVKHSVAVAMLKQTGSKVTLEVVSWLGTEL